MTERLRVFVRPQHFKKMNTPPKIINNIVFPDDSGMGRINELRKYATGLFRYERMEISHIRAIEVQGYAERLLQEAVKNGPCHKPTMELIDFWMLEKDLVHKVFKVLVPRYQRYEPPYSKMHFIPTLLPGQSFKPRVLLEMKGNPYPPVEPKALEKKNSLANILLAEAKREFYMKKIKAEEEKAQLGPQDPATSAVSSVA